MTEPRSPQRRPRAVAGTSARTAYPRRARSGGRGAGTAYAPSALAGAGGGNTWPFRVVADVEPHVAGDLLQRATTRRQSIRSVSERTIPSGPRTCAMRQVFSC